MGYLRARYLVAWVWLATAAHADVSTLLPPPSRLTFCGQELHEEKLRATFSNRVDRWGLSADWWGITEQGALKRSGYVVNGPNPFTIYGQPYLANKTWKIDFRRFDESGDPRLTDRVSLETMPFSLFVQLAKSQFRQSMEPKKWLLVPAPSNVSRASIRFEAAQVTEIAGEQVHLLVAGSSRKVKLDLSELMRINAVYDEQEMGSLLEFYVRGGRGDTVLFRNESILGADGVGLSYDGFHVVVRRLPLPVDPDRLIPVFYHRETHQELKGYIDNHYNILFRPGNTMPFRALSIGGFRTSLFFGNRRCLLHHSDHTVEFTQFADKYLVAHERRHIEDGGDYEQALAKTLSLILPKHRYTPNERNLVSTMILEHRGSATELARVQADRDRGPELREGYSLGTVKFLRNTQDWEAFYNRYASDLRRRFRSDYQLASLDRFLALLASSDPSAYEALVSLLRKTEILVPGFTWMTFLPQHVKD